MLVMNLPLGGGEPRSGGRGLTKKRAIARSRFRGCSCLTPFRLAARATSPGGGNSRLCTITHRMRGGGRGDCGGK